MRNALPSLAFVLMFLLLGSALGYGRGSEEKTQKTSFHFGTPCAITVYGRGSDSFFNTIFARLDELENQLSTYKDQSEISVLNRAAGDGPVAVPKELYSVIKHGIAYSRLSDGAFDITIGPIIELWGITGENPQVPSRSRLDEALALVDYENVILLEPGKRVVLENRGMLIDLGGIAKGYAADII